MNLSNNLLQKRESLYKIDLSIPSTIQNKRETKTQIVQVHLSISSSCEQLLQNLCIQNVCLCSLFCFLFIYELFSAKSLFYIKHDVRNRQENTLQRKLLTYYSWLTFASQIVCICYQSRAQQVLQRKSIHISTSFKRIICIHDSYTFWLLCTTFLGQQIFNDRNW